MQSKLIQILGQTSGQRPPAPLPTPAPGVVLPASMAGETTIFGDVFDALIPTVPTELQTPITAPEADIGTPTDPSSEADAMIASDQPINKSDLGAASKTALVGPDDQELETTADKPISLNNETRTRSPSVVSAHHALDTGAVEPSLSHSEKPGVQQPIATNATTSASALGLTLTHGIEKAPQQDNSNTLRSLKVNTETLSPLTTQGEKIAPKEARLGKSEADGIRSFPAVPLSSMQPLAEGTKASQPNTVAALSRKPDTIAIAPPSPEQASRNQEITANVKKPTGQHEVTQPISTPSAPKIQHKVLQKLAIENAPPAAARKLALPKNGPLGSPDLAKFQHHSVPTQTGIDAPKRNMLHTSSPETNVTATQKDPTPNTQAHSARKASPDLLSAPARAMQVPGRLEHSSVKQSPVPSIPKSLETSPSNTGSNPQEAKQPQTVRTLIAEPIQSTQNSKATPKQLQTSNPIQVQSIPQLTDSEMATKGVDTYKTGQIGQAPQASFNQQARDRNPGKIKSNVEISPAPTATSESKPRSATLPPSTAQQNAAILSSEGGKPPQNANASVDTPRTVTQTERQEDILGKRSIATHQFESTRLSFPLQETPSRDLRNTSSQADNRETSATIPETLTVSQRTNREVALQKNMVTSPDPVASVQTSQQALITQPQETVKMSAAEISRQAFQQGQAPTLAIPPTKPEPVQSSENTKYIPKHFREFEPTQPNMPNRTKSVQPQTAHTQAKPMQTVFRLIGDQENNRTIGQSTQFDVPLASKSDVGAPLAPQVQTPATRMDLPTHVARQVMDVVQHLPNKPVEISLNPEELGRLRLAVSASDAGLIVSVLAERPETLDLLRRHIATLNQEFQALGYEDVSFSFNDDASSDAQTQNDAELQMSSPAPDSDTGNNLQSNPTPLQPSTEAGLDLRL